eukprot:g7023.t1
MTTDFNMELQDPFYHSDLFMMFCFKILPCKKTYRHDWRVCPFAHGDETAKRRDPRLFKYTGVICPDAKKGRSCPRNEDCPCTHSLFEYWLHPTRFKTEICSRGSRCNRPFCFFAHKQSEIRKPNFRLQMQGLTCEPPIRSNVSPTALTQSLNGLHSLQLASENYQTMNSNRNQRIVVAAAPPLDSSSLFQSAATVHGSGGGGGSTSVQDSGSSCDLELPSTTLSSFIGAGAGGGDCGGGSQSDHPFYTQISSKLSPRTEHTSQQHHQVDRSVVVPPLTSMPLWPMLPQIPTMDRDSVDWYSIPSVDSGFQLSSARGTSSTRMSESRRFGVQKSSGIALSGISPRYLELIPSRSKRMMSFKEDSLISTNLNQQQDNTLCNSGYDRNFLLATIQDVYQSMMVSGESPLEASTDPLAALDSDFVFTGDEGKSSLLQSMSYGTGSNQGITSLTGSAGNTCGIEGLQHTNCLSSSSLGSESGIMSGTHHNSFEHMISNLLQTDSDTMSRYFN